MKIGTVRPEEAKVFDSHAGIHRLNPLSPLLEVFWHEPHTNEGDEPPLDKAGWFWWSLSAEQLPDSEPVGPFARSSQAYADAQQETEE